MELGVPVKQQLADTLRLALTRHLAIPLPESVLPIRVIGDGGPPPTVQI